MEPQRLYPWTQGTKTDNIYYSTGNQWQHWLTFRSPSTYSAQSSTSLATGRLFTLRWPRLAPSDCLSLCLSFLSLPGGWSCTIGRMKPWRFFYRYNSISVWYLDIVLMYLHAWLSAIGGLLLNINEDPLLLFVPLSQERLFYAFIFYTKICLGLSL
jgi:hypothetical protein